MPFNYKSTLAYQPLQQGTIEGASKSPFEIAGRAMTGFEDAMDNRIFNRELQGVNSLEALNSMRVPQTKEAMAQFQQKQGAFTAINAKEQQDRLFALQQELHPLQVEQTQNLINEQGRLFNLKSVAQTALAEDEMARGSIAGQGATGKLPNIGLPSSGYAPFNVLTPADRDSKQKLLDMYVTPLTAGTDNRPASYKEYELAVGSANATPNGYRAFLDKRFTAPQPMKDEFGNTVGWTNVGKNIFGSGLGVGTSNNAPVNAKGQQFTGEDSVPSKNTSTRSIFSKAKVDKEDIATYDAIPQINGILDKFSTVIPKIVDGKVEGSLHFGGLDALSGTAAGVLGINTEKSGYIQTVKSLGSKMLGLLGKEEMKGVLSDQDLAIIKENIPSPYDNELQAATKWGLIQDMWKERVSTFNERMEMSGARLRGEQPDKGSSASNTTSFPNAPKVGTEVSGYKYLGGDPSKKESWGK